MLFRSSGTTNPIIIADMTRVLQREFSHMETILDMQSEHVDELLQDKASLRDAVLEAVDGLDIVWAEAFYRYKVMEVIKKAFDEPT